MLRREVRSAGAEIGVELKLPSNSSKQIMYKPLAATIAELGHLSEEGCPLKTLIPSAELFRYV